MGKIIAIANPRGGSGKTTTAIHLGIALSLKEKKTLIIDFDHLMNASKGLGLDSTIFKDRTIYNVLNGPIDIKEVIYETIYPDFQIIPGDNKLIDLETVNIGKKVLNLKKNLASIEESYDYILFDCPPCMGSSTQIALTTCHSYLIPVQCDYKETGIITLLLCEIENIKATLNPSVFCQGLLLTMVNNKNNLPNEIRRAFEELHIFQAEIPRNIRVSEAFENGKDLFQTTYDSKVAVAYQELALEIIMK